jgi:hypothetical protein
MKLPRLVRPRRRWIQAGCLCLWCLGGAALRADQVEMLNGDVYAGRVLSMDTTTLTLQSEVLGTIKLPRTKVSTVRLGATPTPAKTKPAAPEKGTNAPPLTVLPKGATNATADQLLEGATPEARAKFNSMVSGLLTGKMSSNDIRAEAKSIAEQVRAMRGDLGEESGGMLDSYLAILDNFIAEGEAKVEKPAGGK